jgi:hygromycin-B 7''-O-kinase
MPHPALPENPSPPQYGAFRGCTDRWVGILADIAARHALTGPELEPIAAGSNLIAFLGGSWVLKVYPPFLRHQFEAERLALCHLGGRLPVAIPEVRAEGERDGWPYLTMTRLEGWPLADVWPGCSEGERTAILGQIGELVARAHRVPVGEMSRLEPEWSTFLVRQAAGCRSRHERLSLPRPLLDGLEDYLARTADAIPGEINPVILTGEYTPENLLMGRAHARWEVRGLIDFGDAMVGFREYDLLGPGSFLAAGRRHYLRALLGSYGYGEEEMNPGLGRRLMRLLLLHRYSHLDVQVRIDGWRDRVRTWDELQELLWPF